jgi:hypothetical protein
VDRREYIDAGRAGVPGWFNRTDARLFDAIDAAQRDAGVTGDLLEIGCYQGASTILLGYMRRAPERLIVCDVFDGPAPDAEEEDRDQHRRHYRDLSRTSFEANYLTFHDSLPDIVAAPSTALSGLGLGRTFRFIHVDGSHAYETVRSDLLLTRELLVEGGVVVFDDIVSMHTPGVTAAVWEGVVVDGLVPLLQSRKLYCTWGAPLPFDTPSGVPTFWHDVRGHTMRHVEVEQSVVDPAPPGVDPRVDDRADDGTDDGTVTHLSASERRMVEIKRHVMGSLRGLRSWAAGTAHGRRDH